MMINNIAATPHSVTATNAIDTNINSNSYIEIDESVTDFQELQLQENFELIKNKYQESIYKLADLYYFFSGIKCTKDVEITIKTINTINQYNHSDLFYSYKQTRKHVNNIIDYLILYKEHREENNHIPIICSKLDDCFGFCLSGFNSKITDINDYIMIFLNTDLQKKINIQIKKILQEVIRELLLEKRSNREITIPNGELVHYENAFFNLMADELNLNSIIDTIANINNINSKVLNNIIEQIKTAFSKFNLCKYIVNFLYKIFETSLTTIGKTNWLNSNIHDLSTEHINYLENTFIHPINKYLGLENQEKSLHLTDIIIETKNIGCFYFADIKDILHLLIANNINKINKANSENSGNNQLIIKLNETTSIYSIHDCYFYVMHNQAKIALTLTHLLDIQLNDISIKKYISMLLQALDNTKKEEVYNALKSENINKMIFNKKYSKDIFFEINRATKYNETFKKKLLNALTNPYIKQQKVDSLLYKCIKNNILATEIIGRLLSLEVDISNLIKKLNANEINDFIFNLDKNLTLKILSNYKHNNGVINKIYDVFYQSIYNEKFYQLKKILDSELKYLFFNYLDKARTTKLLKNLLNKNNYHLANLFIQDFVKLNILDENQNNILHYLAKNKDETIVAEMISKLNSKIINQLISAKNHQGTTPLMFALTENNNEKMIALLLDIDNNNINLKDNYGNNAIMHCIYRNDVKYLNLVLNYCNNEIINKKNNDLLAPLMLASSKGYLQCVNLLLEKNSDNLQLFMKDSANNNSLMLALLNKHDDCGVLLVEKYSALLLENKNIDGYNALMIATKYNMLETLKKIIDKCSNEMITTKSDNFSNNSLMLSIIFENHECTEELLKKYTINDLNQKNKLGNNVLDLAISYNSNCLEKIIELSTKEQTQNINNSGYNSLSLACYHGLNKNIINTLIKKSDHTIFIENKGSILSLLNAVTQGHVHCIEIISRYLTIQEIINTHDYNDNNCLIIAVKNNYYDCVEYMIKNYNKNILATLIPKDIDKITNNNRIKKILQQL